jgi:magnesium-protoporphyrin O-methyltransferase
VVGVDVSANLIGIAEERVPPYLGGGSIDFRVGDMLDPGPESFDHIVAMDSLIHYETKDIVAALARLAAITRHSITFTVAPETTLLNIMWGMGKLFPRSDRAPAIVPQPIKLLTRRIEADPALQGWKVARTQRIVAGFYTSQAIQLVRQ